MQQSRIEINVSDLSKAILSALAQENNMTYIEFLTRICQDKIDEVVEKVQDDNSNLELRRTVELIDAAFGINLSENL